MIIYKKFFGWLIVGQISFALLIPDSIFAQGKESRLMALPSNVVDKKSEFDEPLDGKDLSQFRGYQTEEIPSGWSLQGRNLVFSGEGSGDIITRETYRDFELQVEWSISEGGNSGIMYRVGLGDEHPYMTGPEIQILDDEKYEADLNELTSAGSLYGLYPAEGKRLKPAGQWNRSRIIVDGNKVTHRLNGYVVFEAEMGSDDWNQRVAESKFKDWPKFNSLEEGHIAFQNHGDEVKFRNIRIKRLNLDDESENDATGESRAPNRRDISPPGGLNRPGAGPPVSGGGRDPK